MNYNNIVWMDIISETIQLAQQEPMLASYFHSSVIKHKNLGDSLSYILANCLGASSMPPISIREIMQEAYEECPDLVNFAALDILAVVTRDPAVSHYSTPLLYLKGFHALQAHRISNWLWKNKRYALAIYLQNQVSVTCQVDIHPAANIGHGIMLDHATGIVIGETAVVGNDVSILQNVTLGGTGKDCGDRHPKVGDGVMIGAGAKVLGNILIGDGSRIGAGSIVLQPIPAHSTAAGIPAKIIGRSKSQIPSEEMDQIFNS